jgi:hypothetical protein
VFVEESGTYINQSQDAKQTVDYTFSTRKLSNPRLAALNNDFVVEVDESSTRLTEWNSAARRS